MRWHLSIFRDLGGINTLTLTILIKIDSEALYAYVSQHTSTFAHTTQGMNIIIRALKCLQNLQARGNTASIRPRNHAPSTVVYTPAVTAIYCSLLAVLTVPMVFAVLCGMYISYVCALCCPYLDNLLRGLPSKRVEVASGEVGRRGQDVDEVVGYAAPLRHRNLKSAQESLLQCRRQIGTIVLGSVWPPRTIKCKDESMNTCVPFCKLLVIEGGSCRRVPTMYSVWLQQIVTCQLLRYRKAVSYNFNVRNVAQWPCHLKIPCAKIIWAPDNP
jgi:hypothetical protein